MIIVGRCLRIEKTGYELTKQACYVHCSDRCVNFAESYNVDVNEEDTPDVNMTNEMTTDDNVNNTSTVEEVLEISVAVEPLLLCPC